MPANLKNSAEATGLEKVSFHSNPKERQCQRMLKLPHNCTHLTPSKVMLKILQVRLQQYVNRELPDVQADFRKGRGIRDQIANICWIIEKAKVTNFSTQFYEEVNNKSSTQTENFQMFKLNLEKAEEPEVNCQHPLDHRKSKRVPEKHLLLLY